MDLSIAKEENPFERANKIEAVSQDTAPNLFCNERRRDLNKGGLPWQIATFQ